jgi:hypothetical protein
VDAQASQVEQAIRDMRARMIQTVAGKRGWG